MEAEKKRLRVQVCLLESLKFPMMNDRYEKLAQAHQETFTWIFKNPQEHHKPWDDFSKWLSTASGTYWIQGKAASGKSTLVRFVWNEPRTFKLLHHWAPQQNLIVATFFFWNSGIPDQRSQVGLLRSLLYAVLDAKPSLIPDVLQKEWDKLSNLSAHDLPFPNKEWSLIELKLAFRRLVESANSLQKFCFFVDGLDEYDGDPEDIAQFFLELSEFSPYSKFCVSSRPWPVFQDIYQAVPGLKLQDLTRDDIRLYTSGKLGSSRQMKSLLMTNFNDANKLIEELVKKSAGVFLWVVLVVKSLVSGLRNGDEITHLRRRLESLPPDLEELYGQMLSSVDPLDREEGSQIFQLFRTSGYSLDIAKLERALRSSEYREVLDVPTMMTKLTKNEIDVGQVSLERMTLRLNSRSKGLLEVLDINTNLQNEPRSTKQPGEKIPGSDVPAEVWFDGWEACGIEQLHSTSSPIGWVPLDAGYSCNAPYKLPTKCFSTNS
jgi:hypothetical protein